MTDVVVDRSSVLSAIREFAEADNPSSFLAVNDGNEYFTLPGQPGAVVYRAAGDWLVQLGGAFAPPDAYRPLLAAFQRFAGEQRRRVVAVQLQRHDAERYAAAGFTVNQIGASYAVHLPDFSLRGTRFMQLRNKISRAFRAGLTVFEADAAQWLDAMRELDRGWLRDKGEAVRPLEFLVGQYGGDMQDQRRLFVGTIDGKLAAYISYSPVYGTRAGWMHDLSRRIPGNVPGLMEAINETAIKQFIGEGVEWLHFGFTPFTSLSADHELPGHSPAFGRFMQALWQYGEAVYPARTQLAYKEKWAPQVVLPEYVAFQGPASVAGFAHIFRACNAF